MEALVRMLMAVVSFVLGRSDAGTSLHNAGLSEVVPATQPIHARGCVRPIRAREVASLRRTGPLPVCRADSIFRPLTRELLRRPRVDVVDVVGGPSTGYSLRIRGEGLGTEPVVMLDDVRLTVATSTETTLTTLVFPPFRPRSEAVSTSFVTGTL